MKTIFSFFEDFPEAETAVGELLARGFEAEEMNVVLLKTTAKNAMDELDWDRAKVEKTDEIGVQKIHGLRRLLAGLQPVRVADTGEIFATGKLASTFAHTASAPGATDDGMKSALMEFDVPEEAAEAYRDGIKAGGILFFIRTSDERAAEAANVLKDQEGKRVASFV